MTNRSFLNIAYPFAEVCDSTAGGAEQVLKSIDMSISESSNVSIVLAKKGSFVSGELIEFDSNCEMIEESFKKTIYKEYRKKIECILQKRQIDLLHFHGLDFVEYVPQTEVPVLVTLHLPINWYTDKSFSIPGIYYNCVSKYQYTMCRKKCNPFAFIENGVSIPKKIPNRKKGVYTLSIGRICPEKGYHLALHASRKANVPFVLAGKLYPYPEHKKYYQSQIKPEIDNNKYIFIGEVDSEKKIELFESALCLLIPSLVDETSSLVAMEAFAHGVPVIAFKAGALNHIIENNVNGFLVQDENEMADAISEVSKIDPHICYTIASQKYSVTRMTSQYLNLYEELISL